MKKLFLSWAALCGGLFSANAQLQTLTIKNNNLSCSAQIYIYAEDTVNAPGCPGLQTGLSSALPTVTPFCLGPGQTTSYSNGDVLDQSVSTYTDCSSLAYAWVQSASTAIASTAWIGVEVIFGTNSVFVGPSGNCAGYSTSGTITDCTSNSVSVILSVDLSGNYIVKIQ